ncbi:MAG: DNA adenine methylase [Lachnospiraceae bacterium]|nr:DNA adenine methylase [Lachnospiraceae bacterium]
MKPLIKWPGGKSGELGEILPYIPEYDRYIEPFAGGAALFFHLMPEKAVLNDSSENLIRFYRLLKADDQKLKELLELICDMLDAIKEGFEQEYETIWAAYRLMEMAAKENLNVEKLHVHRDAAAPVLADFMEKMADRSGFSDIIPDREAFECEMAYSLGDKIRRTVRNNQKKPFTPEDLKANLLTGLISGFYLYERTLLNEIALRKRDASEAVATAIFYYVRENCYGSMFRYNRAGEFNIPYGGISYNDKNMREKVARMFAPETISLMQRTELHCADFEDFAAGMELSEKDFLFLDPPYDTEFSDYEGREFGHRDQERLADFLKSTKASFLLVIKNTDYIRSLYEGHFRILNFEARYLYNMRSRNERKTNHLIITNIPEEEGPLA